MIGSRGVAVLALLLLAVLGAFGFQLRDAQHQSRRAAERRFEQRAQISAALTQSVFSAIGSASVNGLATQFGGSPASLRRRLARVVKQSGNGYVAIEDSHGRVIAHAGAAEPLRGVGASGLVMSAVRQTAAGPLIDYGLRFATPSGAKRVLVEGLPVIVLRRFLEDYLRKLPNPDGATLIVADRGGVQLARVAPSGKARPADDPLTVTAAIAGTTWQLRLQAERSRVLAGARDAAWLDWGLLGGMALAITVGLGLLGRAVRSSRRTSHTNRALRESQGKLRGLVDALEEAVVLVHADGLIELLNASAKKLLETDADSLTDRSFDWLAVNDDGAPMTVSDTPVGRALTCGQPQRQVIGFDRPGRARLWLDVSARPLTRPGETRPYAAVCSCTDVTERQNLEAHLLDLADRDPLTGLWNRRRFEQDLAHQLERARRYDERATLVLMDVDGFKQVNDELGHLVGDEVLCALGDALSSRVRASDRAARLGGDEFAVLLLNLDEADVQRTATELIARMCEAAATAQGHVNLSISFGTAPLDRCAPDVNDALATADRAMYAAKHRGGERRGRREATLRPAIGSTAEMASLRALLAAVNARDSYTAMHSREVVTLARGVARQLGLDEARTVEVEHIALLHDLGKIAVPDAILRKAGPLTSHEQTLMRQHPVVGAQILASMPELAHLAPAVRAEHERWDGGGYPDGLAGEQIPIASRITLVCDAYHAMTSNRPYRRAMSDSAAREEIQREAEAQFCPHAASALLDVLATTPAHAVH